MRGTKAFAALAAGLAACASSKAQQQPPDAAAGAADAPPAAIDSMIDADLEMRALSVDTFADFSADAATLDRTTVETWGAVEPIAWYTGGLVRRGSDTGTIGTSATTTWEAVQGFPSTGRVALEWSTAAGWGSAIAPGVGLTASDNWTQWDEGEIHLEPGTWTFTLSADDHGFVEIAPPGTSNFMRVVSTDWPNETSGTFVASTDDWYPFRFAYGNGGGASGIGLRYASASVATSPIPRDRFRARADQLTGLAELAFDDSHDLGAVTAALDAATPGNADWMMTCPPDLGLTANDTFSVRWSGQLRIDVAGSYTFRYVTDDGQRLWIDGKRVIDAWSDTTADTTSSAIELDVGWHDIVIDFSENTASAAAHLTVASGPDPGLVGLPLPPDRLRPIEARGERVTTGANHTDVAIPDLSTIQSTIDVTAPAGATVTSIDVGYEINHGNWGDLVVTVKAPNGATYVTRNRVDAGVGGDRTERISFVGFAGAPAAGTWTLLVQDAVSGSTGTLLDYSITPHFTGGAPPVPAAASFVSTVRDLGAPTGFGPLTWTARVPAGAGLSVRVRTCADPGACAGAEWSAPIKTSGETPATPIARYLQYRVDFTSDGDHTASLDALTIAYSITKF
jgi:subtilisin-like proprotein convertase family protein